MTVIGTPTPITIPATGASAATVFADLNDLITKALMKAGIVGFGRAASANEILDGLKTFNIMLDEWGVLREMINILKAENFLLTVNKNVYTIGPSGDFNTMRPIRIENAYVRDLQNADHILDCTMVEQEYVNIPVKNLSGIPEQLWYKPDFPLGVVTLDVAPNAAWTLYISSWKPFSLITDPGDATQLVVPDGYPAAFVWNLTEVLLSENKRAPIELVTRKARDTLEAISIAYGEMPKVTSWDTPGVATSKNELRSFFGK